MALRTFTHVIGLVCFACGAPQQAAAAAKTPSAPVAPPKPPAAEKASAANEFQLKESDSARSAQGATASKIKATKTEAAMKFVVVDKDKGPVPGIVISLTAPDGKKFYTEETDAAGYAEVLVPVGQKYELVYLSLARRDISANVNVTNEPNQNVKLTLRYKRPPAPPEINRNKGAPRFILNGVNFDTGKATIRAESFPRLDGVVEYLLHKKQTRIEIAGHTDNVGNPKANKALSLARAQACRTYLMKKGIEGERVVAVGVGDEHPMAPNDTEEGRQQNRRIEATEL